MAINYKLHDLYTQKYLQGDPLDPTDILIESVENSLLEKILPPDAVNRLSLANIEVGMDGEMINNNHSDPENNVLLMSRGSRGLYGPAEYRELLAPYLDLRTDYPYHRYLSNENLKTIETEVKVWVIDDEAAVSGLESVTSKQVGVILGDSHGKISLDLANKLVSQTVVDGVSVPSGQTNQLMQYRMIASDPERGFFAKGTFQAALNNTLTKHGLVDNPDLQGIQMILPTSSIKGATKGNLPPGVHTVKVNLSNHKESTYVNFTQRAVTEKLEGDAFAYAIKQQNLEIEKLNQTFGNSEQLFAEYIKYLQPELNADGSPFDPDNWQQCGKSEYVIARTDYESGHYQLLTSPVFTSRMVDFYASRARSAAELEFVKVRGGMIYCSHELKNDEICVPYLKEGEQVAAIRSPIISLSDIAVVTNRHIGDMYDDAGKQMEGAIICSPQVYERYLNQAKTFVETQTAALVEAGIDVSYLKQLNAFEFESYQGVVINDLSTDERQQFVESMNIWRQEYNALVDRNQLNAPQLSQIRLDTFTAILAADFDGDNIAAVPMSQHREIIAGIQNHLAKGDVITPKLEKIKLSGNEDLATVLARKADPYVVGKTANLAEQLQSLAVESQRMLDSGTLAQKQALLERVTPAFYYLMAQPTPMELQVANDKKIVPSFRDYQIASTGERAIDLGLVQQFDAYNLKTELPAVLNGVQLQEQNLDRSLMLWQQVLSNINRSVAQQNQIAVDTFKSERTVDNEFVEGISKRLRYLNDGLKKVLDDNESYRSKMPEVNNFSTNRALLVQNVNDNLLPFAIQPTPYFRIAKLFPEVNNPEMETAAASAVAHYKRFQRLSRSYRNKANIDSGPSMTFTHKGRKLEVSNLLTYDNTPQSVRALKDNTGLPLQLRIQPNSVKGANHKFIVEVKQDREWSKLGTLCTACQEYNDIDKAEDLGAVADFDFVTPSGSYQAKLFSDKSKKLTEDFRSGIPPEQIADYAAATYKVLTDTSSTRNNFGFMFKAFEPEMVAAVSEFRLTEVTINELTDLEINPEDKQRILIARDDINPAKTAVYLSADDGSRSKVGVISQDCFHPRLGAEAEATISYAAPSVGTFVLPDGRSFTIGNMKDSDTAGEIFADSQLEVEIAMGQSQRIPVLTINGESIGRLHPRSASWLESQDLLKAGQELSLSLTTEGTDFNRKIKALTPNGTLLEVTGINEYASKAFKDRKFSEEEVRLKINFKVKAPVLTAYTVRDGKRVSLGVFGRNRKKDADFVRQQGLVGKSFPAVLTNKVSTLSLKIDSQTLVYPEVPLNQFLGRDNSLSQEARRSVAGRRPVELTEQEADGRGLGGSPHERPVQEAESNLTTKEFLTVAGIYSSMLHYQSRTWINNSKEHQQVDSLDIIIDGSSNLTEQYASALEEAGFQLISEDDPSIAAETARGFKVYSIPAVLLNQGELARLGEQLKVAPNRVFDEGKDGLAAKEKLQQVLNHEYRVVQRSSDELLLDASGELKSMSSMLSLELPVLDRELPEALSTVLPSGALVDLVDTRELLTQTEAVELAKQLTRYDYQWLNRNVAFEIEVTSPSEAIDLLHPESASLTQAREKLQSFLTPEGNLVYQHVVNATDSLYHDQLVGVMGQERYQLYRQSANELIAQQIVPLVVAPGKLPEISASMTAKREVNFKVPLPDLKKRTGAVLGVSPMSDPSKKREEARQGGLARQSVGRGSPRPNVSQSDAKVVTVEGGVSSQKPKINLSNKSASADALVLTGHTSPALEGQDQPLTDAEKADFYSSNTDNSVISNKTSVSPQVQSELLIVGKPVAMTFPLMVDQNNSLPVNNCFDAMRGYGRVHTTRNFEPFKAYDFKEGDLAIAYKGKKESPDGQIVFRVGKQQRLTSEMINNPEFQRQWSQVEKHAPEALPKLFAAKAAAGEEVWGMAFEPLGDLIKGKIHDFQTGKEIVLEDTSAEPGVQLKGAPLTDISSLPGVQRTVDEVVAKRSSLASLAFLSFPNSKVQTDYDSASASLPGDAHAAAKGAISRIIAQPGVKAKVNDTVRVWSSGGTEQSANAMLTVFADVSDRQLIYYAAQIGQQTQQPYMPLFVENTSGVDKMYFLTLPKSENVANIKATVEVMGVSAYTVAPGADSTKVIINDVNSRQQQQISDLIAYYGAAKANVKSFTGTTHVIEQSRYAEIIRDYQHHAPVAGQKLDLPDNLDPLETKMAGKATKFVGFTADSNSSISKVATAFGDRANGNSYTCDDKVFIMAPEITSLPPMAQKELFESQYKPLLNELISAKAKVLVANNPGIDRMTLKYLEHQGYVLKDSGKGYHQAYKLEQGLAPKSVLKDAGSSINSLVLPAVKTDRDKQVERANATGKVMAQILNSTKSLEYENAKYHISYINESKNLLLRDRFSGDLKMSVVFSDNKWQPASDISSVTAETVKDLQQVLFNINHVPVVPTIDTTPLSDSNSPEPETRLSHTAPVLRNRFADRAEGDSQIATAYDYQPKSSDRQL